MKINMRFVTYFSHLRSFRSSRDDDENELIEIVTPLHSILFVLSTYCPSPLRNSTALHSKLRWKIRIRRVANGPMGERSRDNTISMVTTIPQCDINSPKVLFGWWPGAEFLIGSCEVGSLVLECVTNHHFLFNLGVA